MGDVHPGIDNTLRAFIEAQHVFFVATAPLSAEQHVNVSPKGLDALRVLGPHRVAYLDHHGSGAETVAHLRENGRIVLMLCAFTGAPRIVRLHGRGRVLTPDAGDFQTLRPLFPPAHQGRTIVDVEVTRVSTSCGFGVPLYDYVDDRSQLVDWARRKGDSGLRDYCRRKNAASIDGLPAMPPD
ncbi:MAG: pyridoxamine 5'-phosphate oxidase family protein [Acidobacteria bacterium]|nr:pyridoxamine 5'-phosphate oxidase family protein [Acidobacteriota bacterium]